MSRRGSRHLRAVARRVVLAAAVGLTACTSMIPVYERPVAPVGGEWPVDAAPPSGPLAADLPWQTFFPEPGLRALIDTALANNRDLRVAVLNIEQARAQYDIRSADRLPTVGAAASASRSPRPDGGSASTYQVGLALTAWELDFFGRIASLSEVALAQFLATQEGRKAAQITLVSAVASTWLSLAADEALLSITEQTLASRLESLRLSRLRFEAGATSEVDLQLAQSLAETARVTLAQVRRQRAQDRHALALLIGAPLPADFTAGAALDAVALPELPAGIPSEVLVRRPDVRQAEQQLVAANASIGAARAAFFPRISLTAGVGRASTQLSGLLESGSLGLTLSPQLLQPIFDAGRNRAGLRAATVAREIAVAQYERAIQAAFREVADALAARATLAEQLQAQTQVRDAEAARLRLAQLRYDNGISSSLDLLDAQRSLFAARQALVQTQLALLQNQVLLYRALGGGWTEP